MELNIIKQIKSLRNLLRHKPMPMVEKKIIKKEIDNLRPVIKRKEVKPKEIIMVSIDGVELSLKDIATQYNLNIRTVTARYKVGNRGKLLIRPAQGKNPT
jgi:hypothetical protein